jgi:5-methylcytosine-specific restriction protein A
MARLREIEREQVLGAIAVCDGLGRDEFLRRYGYERARAYVLVHDGKAYDSKAIVGVAHGFLSGDERPLTSREFSGGEMTVGRLLRRLGFTVRVSDRLTGDDLAELVSKLHVRRSAGSPALYQPITLLWSIGRALRGEPRLEVWNKTRQQVGDLLDRYGSRSERARPDYPVAALANVGLWELQTGGAPVPTAHGDAELERWFNRHSPMGGLVEPVYALMRDSSSARVASVRQIIDGYFQGTDWFELLEEVGLSDTGIAAEAGDSDDALALSSPLEDAYRRLCGLAERGQAHNDGRRVTVTADKPVRSAAARRAVLLRSQGKCENPSCTGEANDLTDTGDPILEIDHIHDLADGGPNAPAQMAALCPNCHAIKTRGRTREELRQTLFKVARERHAKLTV